MVFRKFFILLIFMNLSYTLPGQNLIDHRWKDRIILLYTPDPGSSQYKEQVIELTRDKQGFTERKLVLYSVTDTHVKKGWENAEWVKRNNSLEIYLKTDNKFEIVLLGLDGGVKLRQESFLESEKLFSRIDAMPMRRSELQGRKN